MAIDQESEWPALKSFAEQGDPNSILTHIKSVENDADRISLYRLAIRKLAFDPWENKDLDVMTAIADAAIEDCEQLGGDYLQQANVIAYNTSANLCDCWEDDFHRQPHHFEKGIDYAKKALWFRDHLGKGPGPKAMATWALGKHQQSLGLNEEATETFRACVELEVLAANRASLAVAVAADAPIGYLIATGFLALMENDQETLQNLYGVLDEMIASGGEAKDEAEIVRSQLLATASNMKSNRPK